MPRLTWAQLVHQVRRKQGPTQYGELLISCVIIKMEINISLTEQFTQGKITKKLVPAIID